MESASQVNVPLRSGGKKMRKRRELDALVAHSLAKRANKKNNAGNGVNSQDQLLSPSTDEQEDFGWPKVIRSSNRTRNRKFSFIRMCAPLIFVTCISLSLGFMYWLYFDLRQQLYEYRQKIEEVSVTSQNFPEVLQKWHETSKYLEQNQTIIYGKITELQRNLGNLTIDFSQYKEKLKEKKDYSKDEKFVAEFGAKIEAVSVDVEGMKERFTEFQKKQATFRTELSDLKGNFSQVVTKASAITNNQTTNYSEVISNVRKGFVEQIKSLASNLSVVNDTLSQKTKNLVDDVISHKKHLDELSDINANTTSHVTSIEDFLMTYKTKMKEYEQYKNEISQIKNFTAFLNTAIDDTRSKCGKYHMEVINFINQNKNKTTNSAIDAIANNEGITIPDNAEKSVSVSSNTLKTTPAVNANSDNISTEMPTRGKPKFLSIDPKTT